MPYDYYEYLKKQKENDDFTQVTDIVRQKIWSESIGFKISQEWLKIEDKIRIKMYLFLRYT
ncbi:hypothetical protein [uncultured Methanobrevibacter sp.]|uniref:hypothetical protein n=1 Tax=uncultured Methanobrevibacter sp. TaxID=253161 RepID=UPI0025FD3C9A|nr:hypothetical protein [uncultured Methanobrevibacter sp.]